MEWNNLQLKFKSKINKILDKQEVLESDLQFDKIFGESLKECLMEEGLFDKKEVGRDTYRNIGGKQVLFKETSIKKIENIK